jgi:hypothetical protein
VHYTRLNAVHAAATQCTRVAAQVRDESFWEYLDMSGHDEFCRKTGDTFFLDGNLRFTRRGRT